jgi:hypothetical protein
MVEQVLWRWVYFEFLLDVVSRSIFFFRDERSARFAYFAQEPLWEQTPSDTFLKNESFIIK